MKRSEALPIVGKETSEPFFICDIHMLEMLAKFKAEGLFDIPVEEE